MKNRSLNLIKCITLVAATIFIFACGKDDSTSNNVTPESCTTANTGNANATFTFLNSNIFAASTTTRCLSCHSSSGDIQKNAGGFNIDSYTGVLTQVSAGLPNSSTIFIRTNAGTMPNSPGVPLSQTQLDALSDWILDCAPNN